MNVKKTSTGILFALFVTVAAWSMEITLVTNTSQDFPHLIGNTDEIVKIKPGVTVDLLMIVGKKAGVEFKFSRMPWKRCFRALQAGQVDGLFFASFNPEREKYGVFPKTDGKLDKKRSYGDAPYFFYKLKSSDITWDGEKLNNLTGKIGVSRGYSIQSYLKRLGYAVEESTGPATDFKKLLLKRVGLVAAIEHNADYLLESTPEFNQNIEKIPLPVISKKYYLIFSHRFYDQHRQLAESIWDALEYARTEHYDRLLREYLGYYDSQNHYDEYHAKPADQRTEQ